MNRKSKIWVPLVLALGLLTSVPAQSQDLSGDFVRDATALRDRALAGSGAWDLVRELTTEVGPRMAGTAGDRAAVAWAQSAMTRLGLANVRAEKVVVPTWERGEAEGRILAPYPQPVILAALGGSIGTPEAGLEAEVVEARSLDELESLDAEAVRGRIVFLNRRTERTRDGSGYGATVSIRTRGAIAAARRGAVGVLIRSVGTDNHRVAHTGTVRYEEGVARVPAAALSIPDADLLEHQLTLGRPVRFLLRLTCRELGEAESANVVAEVRGRERPEEIVLLGAHLDSWDLGPGAIDDGAGVAMVLTAARLLSALPQPPRRTVRVVLFANEEHGLSGGRAYAEEHADELARHVVATEADMGPGRIWRLQSRVAPETLAKVRELAELLAPLGVEMGENGQGGGADLIPLAPARVPILAPSHDASDYFDIHHTADDTLDKVRPEDLDHGVAVYSLLAYFAAEMEGDFGRAPEPPPASPPASPAHP